MGKCVFSKLFNFLCFFFYIFHFLYTSVFDTCVFVKYRCGTSVFSRLFED
jgi:hypothetical protein